jgi:polyhydroxybutyrate depolymerase
MSRPAARVVLALILLLAGEAVAAAPGGPRAPAALDLGGRAGGGRRYLLHAPPTRAGRAPMPIVIALHPAGSSAARFKRYSGLDRIADREGFLAAYPEGSGPDLSAWNAGDCCGEARARGVDDVGFIIAVLRDVARGWPVDRTRVYVTGHSNGGMMAHRVGAERSARIAAVAAVAGAMALRRFAPARPVPVLHIHSVDDGRELYGEEFPATAPPASVPPGEHPVEFELARWVGRDHCHGPAHVVERRAGPPGPGWPAQTATRLVYRPCDTGAEVHLWKLTGAGHGWPGADPEVARPQGPQTTLIDAAEEVWRFLRRFTRPDAPPLD